MQRKREENRKTKAIVQERNQRVSQRKRRALKGRKPNMLDNLDLDQKLRGGGGRNGIKGLLKGSRKKPRGRPKKEKQENPGRVDSLQSKKVK